MRIIAGSLKGRRLAAPTWTGLRPTSDKLRETLFNVVGPRVVGAHVLDGYAGTGAIGLEAISRGAADVVFVERDRRAHALLVENLARCGIADGYAIIRADVQRALVALGTEVVSGVRPLFDLVFLDPPYDLPMAAVLTTAGGVFAPDGLVVVEHARRTSPPVVAGRLVRVRELTAGNSALAFYEARA